MRKHGILIDGEGVVDGGETKVLLQIFSKTVIGPIFFEFIQRKGDDGFGEGNFKALFESIEADQIARGVLTDDAAFANLIASDLELRLDERDDDGLRLKKRRNNGQNLFQRDKRNVDDNNVKSVVEVFRP